MSPSTLKTLLACFKLFLDLAAFFARQVEKREIEDALLNELQVRHKARVDAAVAARDDVASGRVSVDPELDQHNRDNKKS